MRDISTDTLPNWPPERLVCEAALSWNLRHPDEKGLNPDTSDWPALCNSVVAESVRRKGSLAP